MGELFETEDQDELIRAQGKLKFLAIAPEPLIAQYCKVVTAACFLP